MSPQASSSSSPAAGKRRRNPLPIHSTPVRSWLRAGVFSCFFPALLRSLFFSVIFHKILRAFSPFRPFSAPKLRSAFSISTKSCVRHFLPTTNSCFPYSEFAFVDGFHPVENSANTPPKFPQITNFSEEKTIAFSGACGYTKSVVEQNGAKLRPNGAKWRR